MTQYLLYGYPCSGSAAIEAALVDKGIAFEMRDLDEEEGALQSAEYRAINPRGQVPALVHPDGSVITECPAILTHLADAHPGTALAPAPGSASRAQHDRWLAFLHANVYEGILRMFYTERYTTDPATVPPVREAARAYVSRHLELFSEAICDGPFLLGKEPMAVDYLAWTLSTWLEKDQRQALPPKLSALTHAVAIRPALAGVVARNTED